MRWLTAIRADNGPPGWPARWPGYLGAQGGQHSGEPLVSRSPATTGGCGRNRRAAEVPVAPPMTGALSLPTGAAAPRGVGLPVGHVRAVPALLDHDGTAR